MWNSPSYVQSSRFQINGCMTVAENAAPFQYYLSILVECNPACLDNNISKKLQNVTEFVNLQRLIRTREREANYHQTGL